VPKKTSKALAGAKEKYKIKTRTRDFQMGQIVFIGGGL